MPKSRKARRSSGGGASGKRGASRAPAPGQMGFATPDNPVPYIVPEPPRPKLHQGWQVRAYLHARTVLCMDCTGLIPLSPNWRLSTSEGIRLKPNMDYLVCDFEVVPKSQESAETVNNAIAICPYCGTTTPKGYLGTEARGGYTVADWADLVDAGRWGGQVAEQKHRRVADLLAEGMVYGRMGDVEYCHVMHYDYPIYRVGQPPMQGKSPLYYHVPGEVIYHSYLERKRLQIAKGVYRPEDDPMLRDLGLFGHTPSEYAPGLERLARHHSYASVDDMWEVTEVDLDDVPAGLRAFYDPPTKRQPSGPKEI